MRSPLNDICLFLLAAACCPLGAEARRTRINFDTSACDTIMTDDRAARLAAHYARYITLSGYSKTRNASKESILATNSGNETVIGITLEIEYLSTDGRQITRRKKTIPCNIPPGETRKLDFSTWDRQYVFYYHKSPAPHRAQATPYTIRASAIEASCILCAGE